MISNQIINKSTNKYNCINSKLILLLLNKIKVNIKKFQKQIIRVILKLTKTK